MRCANCDCNIGSGNIITYEDGFREICDFDFTPNDEYGGEIDGYYYCQDCYDEELSSMNEEFAEDTED